MNTYQNWHVYRRDALHLEFIATKLVPSPKAAVEQVAQAPGKFVVINSDFTTIEQVWVTLQADVMA